MQEEAEEEKKHLMIITFSSLSTSEVAASSNWGFCEGEEEEQGPAADGG
jgi:hypothetical protein